MNEVWREELSSQGQIHLLQLSVQEKFLELRNFNRKGLIRAHALLRLSNTTVPLVLIHQFVVLGVWLCLLRKKNL